MDRFIVKGPCRLVGEVSAPGSKNSVSKLLAASMLTGEPCEFSNVPQIDDTEITADICRSLGARIEASGERSLRVQTGDISASEVPAGMAIKNRLSVMMLAPLLHRAGQAVIHAAGGDRIGVRPVNFHLEAYRQMGAEVSVVEDSYRLHAGRLRGAVVTLPFPSVSATENTLLAAVLAEGRTYIRNAAIEPEVLDLALFLQKMGAIIDYQTDRTFVIEGVERLYGARHEVMPDRLVAASLGAAALLTNGEVFVRHARQRDMLSFLNTIRRIGGCFDVQPGGIRFFRHGPLRSIAMNTSVHPGFMTDWQPPFAVLLTQAEGMSVIHETVFEDRFGYVSELRKMGADIETYDSCLVNGNCRFASRGHKHSAVIRGPAPLHGADLVIPDLRAGFTQLIAAMAAQGESRLTGVEHVDRGYERIDETFRGLGASIVRERIA